MDDDQVDLFTATLDEPAFLMFPVERNTPCLHEGCTKSQPWAPNVLSFAHTQAGVLQEVYPLRCHPSVQSVLIGSTDEYFTSQLEATRTTPADAGIAPNDGSIYSSCGDTSPLDSSIDSTYLGQRIDMPACFMSSSCFCELAGIGPVVPSNAPTTHTDHTGVDSSHSTNGFHDGEMVDSIPSSRRHLRKVHFPPSENESSDYGLVFPQRTLQDQELPSPAPIDTRVLDLSASFPSREIFCGSLEIQREFPGEPWNHPQPSLKPIKGRPTASFARKATSLEQPITEHRGRYLCGICGEGFAQPQGVRRHNLEKHEPRSCPHCHIFKWARRYLFKKHLREVHPDVDSEAATLDAALRGRRKSLTANRFRTRLHASHSESTTGVAVARIPWRQTTLSSPTVQIHPLPRRPLTHTQRPSAQWAMREARGLAEGRCELQTPPLWRRG